MNPRFVAVLGAFLLLAAGECSAQVPPFIGNGAALFAPQIGVVNSGVQNDVQAVVSADRKYVTLTMRPQISTLLSLQTFEFQTASPQPGFVGGVQAPAGAAGAVGGAGAGGAGAGGTAIARSTSTPPPVLPAPLVLAQTGMTRIGPP